MQSQLLPYTLTQTAWTGLKIQTEESHVGRYVKLSKWKHPKLLVELLHGKKGLTQTVLEHKAKAQEGCKEKRKRGGKKLHKLFSPVICGIQAPPQQYSNKETWFRELPSHHHLTWTGYQCLTPPFPVPAEASDLLPSQALLLLNQERGDSSQQAPGRCSEENRALKALREAFF